ncbi:MAG: recombination-associated protein RdgC [Pseudomonadales bacterium]|nr:recombination-associated protein RdgC [Pseudomonadales bacterium]
MWFKNLRLYRFTRPFDTDTETLTEKLQETAFRPCGKAERSRSGWVSPLGKESESLCHGLGDYLMLCLQKEEKLLPATVIKDVLAERVEQIEAAQGRKVYRKERLQLKDEVEAELLPRAFSRTQKIHAYLAVQEDLLIINTSSATRAEELINCLRESLGSVPVVPLSVAHAPSAIMTGWLQRQEGSHHFAIDQECELFNPLEDSNVVRCKGQDLYSKEIMVHLEAGKQVKKLGVVWNQTLSCVLGNDLLISRLKFEDMILERAQDSNAETAAQQFDQDFAIMSLELSGFCKALFAAFGGLQETTPTSVE